MSDKEIAAPEDVKSLRDWFAGQAAVGVASREGGEQDAKVVARRCYQIADALLSAREERR